MALMLRERFSFYFWTICLLTIWQILLINCQGTQQMYISESGEVMNETQLQTNNCHALCSHCDCMGFYCGEECICECNQARNSTNQNQDRNQSLPIDTICLSQMQNNAKAFELPFELLIQGPNANRIVRTALNMQQDSDNNNVTARNRRSTIVIYKPAMNLLNLKRERRSANDNLDWLSDLTNGLVRPAPMRSGRKIEQQTPKTPSMPTRTRATKEKMWFESEQPVQRLNFRKGIKKNRPAPLYKLTANVGQKDVNMDYDDDLFNKNKRSHQNRQKNDLKYKTVEEMDTSTENLAELLYLTPMKMLDKMPAALRDAIRRIRNNEPLTDNSKKNDKNMEEMRLKYTSSSENSAQSMGSEEEHTGVHDDSRSDTKNLEEMLRNMHKQFMGAMQGTSVKSRKEKKNLDKVNFLQRLQAMTNQ